jgi:radical SAM superfamily enzyme YgiQ (UPF0313 family)
MNYLYSCGLRGIIFGVESGSDEILKLMRKGTNITDVSNVLKHSHTLGIKNILYIMFGFPKETKEDFLKTISFLKENDDYIDLISLSVFGLSKNSYIFDNPCEFGLYNIEEKERTYLDASISYENKLGLTQEQAKHLRNSHKKTIDNINKYPREMNFFREHMFDLISDF